MRAMATGGVKTWWWKARSDGGAPETTEVHTHGRMGLPAARVQLVKRVLETACILATAPLTIPLFAVTATLVWVKLGRPIFFEQERVGLDGKMFTILKFRTMSDKRGDGGRFLPDSERLTSVGSFLRRTSLDEVPQLINVLKGDMSIVGPRPLYARYTEHYTKRELRRLLMRPGITGLAQCTYRNAGSWNQRLELDAKYVDEASISLDLHILLKTAGGLVKARNLSVIAQKSGDPLDVERSYPSSYPVALRALYRRDLSERVRWMRDPGVSRYMQLPVNPTIDATEEWYERVLSEAGRQDFAAYDVEDGELVGMGGLIPANLIGQRTMYLMVRPEFQGQGHGVTIASLIVAWARTRPEITHIQLDVDNENCRAVRIYDRIGFVVEREERGRAWMSLSL